MDVRRFIATGSGGSAFYCECALETRPLNHVRKMRKRRKTINRGSADSRRLLLHGVFDHSKLCAQTELGRASEPKIRRPVALVNTVHVPYPTVQPKGPLQSRNGRCFRTSVSPFDGRANCECRAEVL